MDLLLSEWDDGIVVLRARVETLKWCFLFWIGQVVTVAGILGVVLRVIR